MRLWHWIKSIFARIFYGNKYVLLTIEDVRFINNQYVHHLLIEGPRKVKAAITVRASVQLPREELLRLACDHFNGKLDVSVFASKELPQQLQESNEPEENNTPE